MSVVLNYRAFPLDLLSISLEITLDYIHIPLKTHFIASPFLGCLIPLPGYLDISGSHGMRWYDPVTTISKGF